MDTKTIIIPNSYMKNYLVKSKSLLCFFVMLCISTQSIFGTTNIWVKPYEINFDYEPGQGDDAITIRDEDGDEAPIPEWKYSPSRNNSIAYIKSQTDRKIKVKFDSNCSDMHLIINLTVTSGTGIGEVCNHVIMNYEDLQEVTLTLEGNIPNNVDVRQFTWKWEIYGITNESGYCSAKSTNYTTHTYYTVLTTPQSPMAEPWSNVLDYACEWASGKSTESDVISSITNSLYNCGVEYDGATHYTSGYYSLNLSLLLDHLDTPSTVQMDCRDFANFLHVLTNSLGLSGKYNVINNLSPPYDFDYNYILPAGLDEEITGNWLMHQVGWYNYKVADASAKIDNDSSPSSSPHSWKLVVGDMLLSAYLDKLSEEPLSSVQTGTCSPF